MSTAVVLSTDQSTLFSSDRIPIKKMPNITISDQTYTCLDYLAQCNDPALQSIHIPISVRARVLASNCKSEKSDLPQKENASEAIIIPKERLHHHHVDKRIRCLYIYSTKHVEALIEEGKKIRLDDEKIVWPFFSERESLKAYLEEAYFVITQDSEQNYIIKAHIRGLGGGHKQTKQLQWSDDEYEKESSASRTPKPKPQSKTRVPRQGKNPSSPAKKKGLPNPAETQTSSKTLDKELCAIAHSGNVGCEKYGLTLIEKGVNPNIENVEIRSFGSSYLDSKAPKSGTFLHKKIIDLHFGSEKKHNLEMVKVLIPVADLGLQDNNGDIPLSTALDVLKDKFSDSDLENDEKSTAAFYEVILLLIKYTTNFEIKNHRGETPLCKALRCLALKPYCGGKEFKQIVDLLLDAGAKVIEVKGEKNPLLYVFAGVARKKKGFLCGSTEEKETIDLLSKMFRAGLRADSSKALLAACRDCSIGIVELLIQNGASANAPDVLLAACRDYDPDIVKLLLQNGADADTSGVLLAACGRVHKALNVVRLLVDAGATGKYINEKTDEGRTPFSLAITKLSSLPESSNLEFERKQWMETISWLLGMGADPKLISGNTYRELPSNYKEWIHAQLAGHHDFTNLVESLVEEIIEGLSVETIKSLRASGKMEILKKLLNKEFASSQHILIFLGQNDYQLVDARHGLITCLSGKLEKFLALYFDSSENSFDEKKMGLKIGAALSEWQVSDTLSFAKQGQEQEEKRVQIELLKQQVERVRQVEEYARRTEEYVIREKEDSLIRMREQQQAAAEMHAQQQELERQRIEELKKQNRELSYIGVKLTGLK